MRLIAGNVIQILSSTQEIKSASFDDDELNNNVRKYLNKLSLEPDSEQSCYKIKFCCVGQLVLRVNEWMNV